MKMEVIVPAPAPVTVPEFNFDSGCSSPYLTAPSSPQRFGNFFFTAPTSPTQPSTVCSGADFSRTSFSGITFEYEKRPEISNHNGDEDFAFEINGNLENDSISAEELFDRGKFRPLKLPPSYDSVSPPSPAAMEPNKKQRHQRGRELNSDSSSSNFSRKGTKSLPPLRVSDIVFEEIDEEDQEITRNRKSENSSAFSFSSTQFSKRYRKWKFKDFLLFRSASEGRSTGKNPILKYSILCKKTEKVENLSFRSSDGVGSVSNRRGPVSAHEVHYTVNRAVAEEMKRKTYLPYRQGLLGCLGFNNHGMNEISRGIGSLTRG